MPAARKSATLSGTLRREMFKRDSLTEAASGVGERQIQVDCDVLQADGGTRTASICGGYLALHDALARLAQSGAISQHPLTEHDGIGQACGRAVDTLQGSPRRKACKAAIELRGGTNAARRIDARENFGYAGGAQVGDTFGHAAT